MRYSNPSLIALPSAKLIHADTFPSIANTNDWQYVRTTTNYQSNGPVTDVSSDQIRCYERNPGTGASGIYAVTAGQTIKYNAKASISHPGPMSFYIAKVPSGQTAATWDGKGAVWTKIYQDMPKISSGGMTWPTQGEFHATHIPLLLRLTYQSRRHVRPRHHPQVLGRRRLPAARRAHRPAQRQQRRRRPILHFVRAAQSKRRLRLVEPEAPGLVPRRV